MIQAMEPELRLVLPQGSHVLPGGRITATLFWREVPRGSHLVIRLCRIVTVHDRRAAWVAASETIDDPLPGGTRTLSFTAPLGPWSATGRLGSLAWVIEAVAYPRRRAVRVEVLIAPSDAVADVSGGSDELRAPQFFTAPR
jgi:hypothetical protein